MEIMNYLHDNGYTQGDSILLEGLWGACEGGQIKIVNHIVDNRKKILRYQRYYKYVNHGMSIACCGGYIEIVKLLMKNGANKCCGKKKCLYVKLTNAEN